MSAAKSQPRVEVVDITQERGETPAERAAPPAPRTLADRLRLPLMLIAPIVVIAGALYGLGMILCRNKQNPQPPGQLAVPFGAMLCVAGVYCIFLGQRTLGWYLQFFH